MTQQARIGAAYTVDHDLGVGVTPSGGPVGAPEPGPPPEFEATNPSHNSILLMDLAGAPVAWIAGLVGMSVPTMESIRRGTLYVAARTRAKALLASDTPAQAAAAQGSYRAIMHGFATGVAPSGCKDGVAAHTAFQAAKVLFDREEPPPPPGDTGPKFLNIIMTGEAAARMREATTVLKQQPDLAVPHSTRPDSVDTFVTTSEDTGA